MAGQHVDNRIEDFCGQSSVSTGKTMVWILLIVLPYIVYGYSEKDPVAGNAHYVDGLNFDIEDCRNFEECGIYFNKSEEETFQQPCLIQGELKASSNWYGYLANGTLAANGARFYYRIVYPEEKCCIKLLLYLEDQVSALRAHMNCLQRQSIIATNPKQIITLSPSVESSGCTSNHTINGQKVIECNSGRILRSIYDQTWHFAASSCGSPTGLSMQYNLVMYGLRTGCPDPISAAPAMMTIYDKLSFTLPSALAIYHAIFWLKHTTTGTTT